MSFSFKREIDKHRLLYVKNKSKRNSDVIVNKIRTFVNKKRFLMTFFGKNAIIYFVSINPMAYVHILHEDVK